MKNIFKLYYHLELILEMLKNTRSGALASNFVGAWVVAYLVHNVVPLAIILVWAAAHGVIYTVRVLVDAKLTYAIKEDKYKIQKYFKWYVFWSSATALLHGSMAILAVHYGIETNVLFVIVVIIITLTAGSIGTLGTVHVAFVAYMFLNIIPLIVALVLQGGSLSYIVAFVVSVFLVIHIISGYRHFVSNQNMVVLQHKFKTLYDKSSDGIALIKKREIIEANEAFLNLFGFGENLDLLLKKGLMEYIPKNQPNGKNSLREMLHYLRKGEQGIVNFEWQHKLPDGTLFWVEITLIPLAINKEEIVQGIWRNIDARKQAEQEVLKLNANLEKRVKQELEKNRLKEEQLVQQSRMAQMGEMLSMIAHQWRQPLGSIGSVVANLKLQIALDDYDDASFNEKLEDIESYISHLSQTVDDFKNFYKPNKNSEYVTASAIVEKSLAIINGSLKSDGVVVEKQYESTAKIEMYSNEMMQVVLNILKNAQDNFREKAICSGKLIITITDDSIRIVDNGGGIDAAILPSIFDPYFSTKNEKNGTGLGLYMSKTIVEDHHKGKLNAYNKGDGVCFEIRFKPTINTLTV